MNSQEEGSLLSPVSITKELWPWCLSVICILTVAWTALIAWDEVTAHTHQDIMDTSISVGTKAATAVPLILIYSIIVVLIGNFVFGGGIMVTARAVEAYLQGKIEERRKQWRERWREEGRLQGREQGIEQGREALATEVADWNRRRLDAEKRGEPFDEPPPEA